MTTVERKMSSTSTKLTSRSSSCSTVSSTRKQNRSHFAKYYSDLCHIQHSHPLSAIKQNLNKGILNFYCDRIKFEEWWSIINALGCDKTLHFVAIRSRHSQKQTIESADTELKAKAITKQPVVITRFVLLWLAEAIKMCLSQSSTLTVLELEGLPLSGDYLNCINRGLVETTTLQHLSLSKCLIRDEGAELICHTIKNLPSIVSLDLSHCCLTERGAEIIAGLIKYQKLNRYSEAWKQTLRYRDPDVEAMPGLRRITINSNPGLGDKGINILVEEIKDDLWLRALDVQDCGLTNEGGRLLLDLLDSNSNLVIVDGRGNPFMHEEILLKIMNQLAINNQNKNDTEYKWINKNPDLNKRKSQVAISTSRPWTCQSTTRFTNKAPPPTECCSPMISGGPSQLKRSNTMVSSGSFSKKNQKECEKFKAKKDSISSENERLRLQLRDLTLILSQEVRHKLALMEENKNLKELIEKQESEKKKILKPQNKKVLVDEDTLKVLEETLSRFGIFMEQKKRDEDEETTESTSTRSTEDYETPELTSNQLITNKSSNSSEKLHENFQKHKVRRSKSDIKQPINLEKKLVLDLHVGDIKKTSLENHRMLVEKKRGTHWLKKDQVIWEEEEASSNCGDLPKNSKTDLGKTKAQAMFMKILEGNQERNLKTKNEENYSTESPETPNSQDEISLNDFNYDNKSNEIHQKPLSSSNEENSS